jgi:hypothetical protein
MSAKIFSPLLLATLQEYIKPVYLESKMHAKRDLIQGSKQLNSLLHHNHSGLQMIFDSSFNVYFRFDWNSAMKVISCL